MVEIVSSPLDDKSIETALSILRAGGLVVLPTDTVYGVAAAVERPDGVAKLYYAKGRPLERAIPVLVSSIDAAERLSPVPNETSRILMRRFWPGPLTIVVPAVAWLPVEIVRDTGSVGLRMPDHPVALRLIGGSGGALAVTSANRSGEPETRSALDAAQSIGDRVDLVVDGGYAPGGVPSTVVRVDADGSWSILRNGAVSREELALALDESP